MQIRPLNIFDSYSVADLHYKYLHTNFFGRPGIQLLQLYYRAVSLGIGAYGFVAESSDGVLGFICGVWDRKALYWELIKNYSPGLLFWTINQILIQPSLLLALIQKLDQKNSTNFQSGYELRPIVLSQSARGTGIAIKLAERLFNDAEQRGFADINLFTEENNIAARKLYQKLGFQVTGRFHRSGNIYIGYERRLDK